MDLFLECKALANFLVTNHETIFLKALICFQIAELPCRSRSLIHFFTSFNYDLSIGDFDKEISLQMALIF